MIFFIGNLIAPYIIDESQRQVSLIYMMGDGSNRMFIFLLLFLLLSWRRNLLESFSARWLHATYWASGVFSLGKCYICISALFLRQCNACFGCIGGRALLGSTIFIKKRHCCEYCFPCFFSAFIFAVFPIH